MNPKRAQFGLRTFLFGFPSFGDGRRENMKMLPRICISTDKGFT